MLEAQAICAMLSKYIFSISLTLVASRFYIKGRKRERCIYSISRFVIPLYHRHHIIPDIFASDKKRHGKY